jgi:hypothetical protein
LCRLSRFAEGKKLKRFDLYLSEEVGKRELRKSKLY